MYMYRIGRHRAVIIFGALPCIRRRLSYADISYTCTPCCHHFRRGSMYSKKFIFCVCMYVSYMPRSFSVLFHAFEAIIRFVAFGNPLLSVLRCSSVQGFLSVSTTFLNAVCNKKHRYAKHCRDTSTLAWTASRSFAC